MDYTRMAVDYLNGRSLGATAYRAVPSDRPASFMTVELTGGGADGIVVRSPSVDVDCWSATPHDAEELASRVVDAMLGMPDVETNVFYVEVSAFYANPDPDSGSPRVTVGFDITTNE